MNRLYKTLVDALDKSAIFYSLHPFTISKNKMGVANNIGKIEGKRAVVDNQRFNRGQIEGIKRATRAVVDYQILKKIA